MSNSPCYVAQLIRDQDAITTASRAARVLLAIAPAYDGDNTKTGIQDALSDLLHLCDLAGWSFNDLLSSAETNYGLEALELGTATDDALRIAIEEN